MVVVEVEVVVVLGLAALVGVAGAVVATVGFLTALIFLVGDSSAGGVEEGETRDCCSIIINEGRAAGEEATAAEVDSPPLTSKV